MTIEDLKQEAIEAKKYNGLVVLRVLKGCKPRSFPKGDLLGYESRKGKLYRIYGFDPDRILKWIKKQNLSKFCEVKSIK
ncbi:MAG: hypothetical protein DRQ02_10430 [Candidatus Latescibacterota bacterium]|nr:MAG: hypothetical protein DRQ02_10430 [Candidatus Latescibacterota bacterium]